ncbi:hypothetical protein [Quadrisphaera sp. INWT6]|uniref:hypothetical protein n=1 Tax=Quadrisphaera sp. INWT6 TaxID=2596917 RepID=UPI0019D67219|nr:hypothetical protein [Quadrisphaera sp. INWT6]
MPEAPAGSGAGARRDRTVVRTAFAVAVLLQLVVLYAPRAPSTGGVPGVDKAVHLAVFGLVAWTGLRAGAPGRLLLPLLLAHAVVSEVLQDLVLPDRSGDPLDAVADAVGVLLGAALAVLAGRRASQRLARRGRTAGGTLAR